MGLALRRAALGANGLALPTPASGCVVVRGTVVAFDEHAGFGTLRADDGRELFFHCTQLTDGTRRIDVGTGVRFEVVAGHLGRWEGAGVERLDVRP